jgi:multidrug efflux pump subunit AcrA (membrane-fusion protein)
MAVYEEERANKKKVRQAIIVFFLVMLALTFFSNTILSLSLAEVTVEQSAAGVLSHEVSGSGTVEAAETADLYVETNWAVSEVNIKAGDYVKAGQELVVFRTRDAEDSLKDNQARYEQKRLNLQKLQDNYTDVFRSNDDKQMRTISRDIETTKLDMQILERQIAALQRQLAEYSRFTSPVDGIVTELNAVKGAPVANGKAAVRIADLSKGQQMKAMIAEEKAQYVKVGDETDLLFVSMNNARIKAKITDIRDATAASASSSSNGTSPASSSSASFQDKKELTFTLKDDRLKGGESGEFNIVKKTATFRSLLPNDAIRVDSSGEYVLLLKEKKGPLGSEYVAQRANIQTGDADDTKTSVENGLTPLDKVIVSTSKSVIDGDRVIMSN